MSVLKELEADLRRDQESNRVRAQLLSNVRFFEAALTAQRVPHDFELVSPSRLQIVLDLTPPPALKAPSLENLGKPDERSDHPCAFEQLWPLVLKPPEDDPDDTE